MTNEEKQVADWMVAHDQEVPDKPTMPSFEVRKLRARLMLEETLETINKGLGLYVSSDEGAAHNDEFLDIRDIVFCEAINKPSLVEIADGCADLMVVTLGTKAACGLLKDTFQKASGEDHGIDFREDPIFNEVMRSNWTKLWTHEEAEKEFGCLTYEAYEDKMGFELPKPLVERADGWICRYTPKSLNRCWLVTDSSGKVIKSPSYSPANVEQLIK